MSVASFGHLLSWLWRNRLHHTERLVFDFAEREVQFSGWGTIIGLFFRSIKDRGWEDARFEVGDYEFGGIHLYCFEISLFNPEVGEL